MYNSVSQNLQDAKKQTEEYLMGKEYVRVAVGLVKGDWNVESTTEVVYALVVAREGE